MQNISSYCCIPCLVKIIIWKHSLIKKKRHLFMTKYITDIELSRLFPHSPTETESIPELYAESIENINRIPQMSILNFRKILERIAELFQNSDEQINHIGLYKSLTSLYNKNIIPKILHDECHKVRRLCNPIAHAHISRDNNSENNNQHTEVQNIKSKAEEIRRDIINIFCLSISLIDKQKQYSINEIIYVEPPTHDEKEILFRAIRSGEAKALLQAGLLIEAEHQLRLGSLNSMIISESEYIFLNSLENKASLFFDTAWKINAHNRVERISTSIKPSGAELQQEAETDFLYHFGKTACWVGIEESRRESASNALKIATKRGHLDATASFVEYCYDKEKEEFNCSDELLEKNILHLVDNEIKEGYFFLYYLHRAHQSKATIKDLINCLEEGCKKGYADCHAILAEIHFKGDLIPKDAEKGKKHQDKARTGHSVYQENKDSSNTMFKQVTRKLEKMTENLKLVPTHKPISPKNEVTRNEPCPCGSGKKYKKCCIK